VQETQVLLFEAALQQVKSADMVNKALEVNLVKNTASFQFYDLPAE